jgi:hypothetical protein
MKTKILFPGIALLAILGCANEEVLLPENTETVGVKEISSAASASKISSATSSLRALPRPTTWADCELFAGVVTPATFKPEAGNFDILYAMPIPGGGFYGFRDGSPLISESKPGDRDYNGGRWHMYVLKEGIPPSKYADACRDGVLDLDDFEPTNNYFECPLLPRRSRN